MRGRYLGQRIAADRSQHPLRELCSLEHYSDMSLPESLLIGGILAVPFAIFGAGFAIGRHVRRSKH